MSINIEKQGENELLVKLVGKLNVENSEETNEEIKKYLNDDINRVVFDLEGLTAISSAGIRILLSVAKVLGEREGTIDAINYSDYIKRVLDITDFFELCTKE